MKGGKRVRMDGGVRGRMGGVREEWMGEDEWGSEGILDGRGSEGRISEGWMGSEGRMN